MAGLCARCHQPANLKVWGPMTLRLCEVCWQQWNESSLSRVVFASLKRWLTTSGSSDGTKTTNEEPKP